MIKKKYICSNIGKIVIKLMKKVMRLKIFLILLKLPNY